MNIGNDFIVALLLFIFIIFIIVNLIMPLAVIVNAIIITTATLHSLNFSPNIRKTEGGKNIQSFLHNVRTLFFFYKEKLVYGSKENRKKNLFSYTWIFIEKRKFSYNIYKGKGNNALVSFPLINVLFSVPQCAKRTVSTFMFETNVCTSLEGHVFRIQESKQALHTSGNGELGVVEKSAKLSS